ncbi:hypothetical protein KAR91_87400, partial [Candidatus Pacearchaeota archaeon]|nr:hypothetical protein [Candidatus Pacearchaeota archaeon]
MVRLSEISAEPEGEVVQTPEPSRMRLSDAMRISPYEIPQKAALVDKGIGANLVEGVLKGFASAPQIAGNLTMAYGDYVRTTAEKADKQGL